MKQYFSLLILIVLFSCNNKEKKQRLNNALKVVEAKGYIVPKDSMAEPKVVLVDESKLKKVPVGKPKVVPTNTNVHPAGKGKVVILDETKLRIITSGTDTFSLPKTVPAIDSPFVAGIPEVTLAKDPHINDNNPLSFSSFSKLQGLKHGNIGSIIEDKSGNLWFGTLGGGVSKYDGKNFTHFTKSTGLSNNVVNSIIEDKSGNLWFGTLGGGVSKYDGKSFTHFNEATGLSNNFVVSTLEDKSGNLWFGTDGGGVCKYDGKSFTHFNEEVGLSNNSVYAILEDKSGNLWFGTLGGGVCKYDGKSFTHFNEETGLISNAVLSMLEDKFGNLWFGSSGAGVCKFDGKSFTHFNEEVGLSSNVVLSILEDKSGKLWFGTDGGGISKYDGKSFTHFNEAMGLSNNTVFSILEDKSGKLWFGTAGGGACKYDGKSFTHFNEAAGLSNNVVFAILKDKSGNLWFGTCGGGVLKYDGKSFTHFNEATGLSNNVVQAILEDKYGNLWFGTDGGGISKYDGQHFTHFNETTGLSNNFVRSMLEDKSGNLWFGTLGGGVCKYNGKSFTQFNEASGLSNNVVNAILEDKSGNLWFGTYGGGVSKLALSKVEGYDTYTFTHFNEAAGLSNNVVNAILEDRSGNLWFGTYGGGVCKYDGKSFTQFYEASGLNNNAVLSMLEDKSGNLWFGTTFGIGKLTPSKLIEINDKVQSNNIKEEDVFFKNYSYEDGFLGIGCFRNSINEAQDGTIWIGTNDRLTAMHPENMPPDTIAPNIQLTNIQLFNENIPWAKLENKKDSTFTLGNGVNVSNFSFDGLTKWYALPENLSLAYNNNYLTFNFIGITMAQPKNVKYQYRLEGLDENWSALTNRTEAPYGNLPHGNYTFKVKAMNSEGYWSAPFEYRFTIRPPWWKTWWAYGIYFITIIGSVWYYIKWREKALKQRQVELEHTVEVRTAEVVEQKHIIEEKHKEITDSINYAERIQRSFMATTDLLNENLKDYFVLFEPKDVVSGDFYWASKLNNGNFVLATADSTGHGVPGAIMSILNISSLEKALEEQSLNQPCDILNYTRTKIIERLKKDGSTEGGKDGMDCSLISFDFNNKQITYAAANNPIWIVRSGELLEFKPDKMPVGKHDKDSVPFSQHTVAVEKGDVIYTLTDGLPDQFGGEKGKKLMYKQLKELLLGMVHLSMHEQKEKLKKGFIDWKGDLEQVDDVCVIGVRIG